MLLRLAALFLTVGATFSAFAQEALNDLPRKGPIVELRPPVSNAWIDLRQHPMENSSPQTAPDWVESVNMNSGTTLDGMAKTVFRIRVSHPSPEFQVMFFRLFFDDKQNTQPQIVASGESGVQVLRSGQLGSGVGLASSESVVIPMTGISTVDIEVPGDGRTVRGAYLDWMASGEVVHPVNAEHRDVIPEPFSSLPQLHPPEQDREEYGTVTATLANDTIAIGSDIEHSAIFQFEIEQQPLAALVTFEVASPRIDSPPEVYVNGEDVGPATIMLPELADPAYRGEMEPLLKEMHFQYTGWLRAQKLIPANSLRVGTNDVMVLAGPGTSASAIRATQVQLKYLWEKSDYLLKPSH